MPLRHQVPENVNWSEPEIHYDRSASEPACRGRLLSMALLLQTDLDKPHFRLLWILSHLYVGICVFEIGNIPNAH